MASKKTIILLIIFLALLAYVYFFEIQGERRKKAQHEQEQLVLNVDKEKVAGISFLPEKIIIEKNDSEWKILFPVQTNADQSTIDNILDSFSSLKQGRFVSDNRDDFHKFGLTPFQSALVINKREENGDTLFLGNTNLDSTKVFYRKSGSNSVYLVATTLKTNATKSLYDLRDKAIVSFEQDSVTEIILQHPDFTFHCIKDSTKKWFITQPESGLAKSWKISSLLYNIKDMKVAQFIDKPYKPDAFYGFVHPAIKLILKKEDQSLTELLLGKKVKDKIYLKNNLTNHVYLVKIKVTDDLSVKTEKFLEK